MKKILFCPVIALVIAACSEGGKKVLVMSSGNVQINGNSITLQPGSRHNETSFVPEGDSITVTSPAGTTGFSVKQSGYYLLNLKKDTIAGAYQQVGTNNEKVISVETLRTRLDSLSQLMKGTNVSEKSRNFNLPPFTIARLTGNTDAEVIGPYLRLPGSFDPSREHEVYKFYTNKEIADIIAKSSEMAK